MLIPCMVIFLCMVHAEQIGEPKLKQVGTELKKARTEEGNSSKNRCAVQDKLSLKKRFSNKGSCSAPRDNKSKVPTPNP